MSYFRSMRRVFLFAGALLLLAFRDGNVGLRLIEAHSTTYMPINPVSFL